MKSLIFDAAKGIKPEVYLERVDVVSVNILDGTETFNSYILSDVISSDITIKLEDNDHVTVYSIEQVEGVKLISIGGYGVEDQTIAWKENFSLYDFIFSARIKNQEIQNQLEVQNDFIFSDRTKNQEIKNQEELKELTELFARGRNSPRYKEYQNRKKK